MLPTDLSDDATLASQLRIASRRSRHNRSQYASSRLASSDDGGYANRLAQTANAYRRALLSTDNTDEGRRVQDFASSLTRGGGLSKPTQSRSRAGSGLSRWTSRFADRFGRRGTSDSGNSTSRRSGVSRLSAETRELLSLGAAGVAFEDLASQGRWGTIDHLHAQLASLVNTGPRSTLPPYQSYENSPPRYSLSARPYELSAGTGGSGVSRAQLSQDTAPSTGATQPSVYELDSRPVYPTSDGIPSSGAVPRYTVTDNSQRSWANGWAANGLPPTPTGSAVTTLSNPSIHSRTLSNPSVSRHPHYPRRRLQRQPGPRTQSKTTRSPYELDTLSRKIATASKSIPDSVMIRRVAEYTRSPSRNRCLLSLAQTSDALSRIRPSTLSALSSLRQSAAVAYQQGGTYSALSDFASTGNVHGFYSVRPKLDRFRAELQSGRLGPEELGEMIEGLQSLREMMLWRAARSSS